jgi:hypothetical protein
VTEFKPSAPSFNPNAPTFTAAAPAFNPSSQVFTPNAPAFKPESKPEPVKPKKTELELGLEKILGGEKEAAPLKDLLSKITTEKEPKIEEDFLKKVLDCIKPCTSKSESPNVLTEILEREEPAPRSL